MEDYIGLPRARILGLLEARGPCKLVIKPDRGILIKPKISMQN